MKIYEELTRIKVNEALHSGLAAQKGRNMKEANIRQTNLSAEQQEDLYRTLFSEARQPGIRERKPRISVLVYFALSLGLALAITAAVQGWLLQ